MSRPGDRAGQRPRAITGFALAALVAHAIDGALAFAAAALVSTTTYFLVAGAGATLLFRRS